MTTPCRLLLSICAMALLVSGCGDDDGGEGKGDGDATHSTLVFSTKMVGEPAKNDGILCSVVDQWIDLQYVAVSSGTLEEGDDPDGLEWHRIYDEAGLVYFTSISLQVDLPVGYYNNYRMPMGCDWGIIADCGGTEVEFVMDMGWQGEGYKDGILNENGAWDLDADGLAFSAASGEVVGGFEIRAGTITNVTWQSNFAYVVWNDVDESGDWSDGDEILDIMTPEGVTSMFEMIVEYEDE